MKFAGMSRALLFAVLGLLVISASATAVPLRASVADAGDAVADGTDIFWTSDRRIKPTTRYGYDSVTSLWRTSFLGGPKTLVKRFDPSDTATGFPRDVLVGGDFVYVNMEGEGPSSKDVRSSSTVLRMRRDGSDLQKVAYGVLNTSEEDSIVIEKGKGRLNDCGTTALAQFAAADGSVVIVETTADRESKACGRKKNVDHNQYYLLSPAGIKRPILSEDVRIQRKIKVFKDGGYEGSSGSGGANSFVFDVIGDRALILRGNRLSAYVRDLTTGAESGPYRAPVKGKDPFNLSSMDSSGRVVVSGFSIGANLMKPKFELVSGIFSTPGDTASYLPLKGQAILRFCGEHLVALTKNGSRVLDPVTLNLLRPIAPVHRGRYVDESCDASFLYMSARKGRGATFLAYPLN